MSKESLFKSLDEFIKELKKVSIQKIAFAETDETRAVQTDNQKVEVVRFTRLELLAYKDSIIYKHIMENLEIESVYKRLESEGFEIIRRSRNIT